MEILETVDTSGVEDPLPSGYQKMIVRVIRRRRTGNLLSVKNTHYTPWQSYGQRMTFEEFVEIKKTLEDKGWEVDYQFVVR